MRVQTIHILGLNLFLSACGGSDTQSPGSTGGRTSLGVGGSTFVSGGSPSSGGASFSGGVSATGGRQAFGGSTSTMGGAGRGGAGRGGAAAGGSTQGKGGAGGAAGGTWLCLDVPDTLCFCSTSSTDGTPSCSAGWPCCFTDGSQSCQCLVVDEDECTSTIALDARFARVESCPP
jgi:hypothetical protein